MTDMGANLCSKVMEHLIKLCKSKHITSTAFRHQSMGQVERQNQTIERMLAKYVGDNHETWDEYLALVRFAINISPTDATGGHSPYLIVHGREPTLALDLNLRKPDKITKTVNTEIEDIILKITTLDKIVKDNIDKNKILMKKYYDQYSTEPKYKIGDQVWLYLFVQPKHLNSKFKTPYTGPFRIIGKENFNFKLRRVSDNKIMPVAVHPDRLLPVYNKIIRPPIPPIKPTQMSAEDETRLSDNIIETDFHDDDKVDHAGLDNPAGLSPQGLALSKPDSSTHNINDDESGLENLFDINDVSNTLRDTEVQLTGRQITAADDGDQAPSASNKLSSNDKTVTDIDATHKPINPNRAQISDNQRLIYSVPKARLIDKTTYYYIIYDDQPNKNIGRYVDENELSENELKYVKENRNKIKFLRSKPKIMNDLYNIDTTYQYYDANVY
jgi:hypothetical protein